jgi:hypothetical protein
MNNKESIVQSFVELFPEFKDNLKDHIDYNDEILPHVFFGDEVNPVLVKLIKDNTDINKLVRIFNFLEESMFNNADMSVRQILSTTILARLGDEPELLKTSFGYMGENTKKLSGEIELFLERKDF